MFNNKTNTSIYFLFLFLFISFDLNAIDEFDYNLLSEKLNRLEQEISDIHKSLYSTNDNTLVKEDQKSVPLKYQRRINKMENDFAKMNGQFEEIFFRLSTNKNVPSEEGLPLSKKDRSGEKDTYAYPKNTSDVNTVGGDVEILGTIEKKDNIDEPYEIAKNFQSPESLFNHGKDSLRNLNYENAEMAFRGFIKKYPEDDKVPSAYYWLGESLFVRENYPEAVLAYGEIIKNYKKHNKASASLLKIGISFSNLDKKKESCDALNKILKQYPNSERDILKKTNYIIQENNC